MDGPTFLERELVGLGVDGYRASGTVHNNTFTEHLTCFPNVKKLNIFYIGDGI